MEATFADVSSNFGYANGGAYFYRWGGAARVGKWCVWLDFPGHHFVAIDCVMDDFGTLVPVVCRPSYGIEVQQ